MRGFKKFFIDLPKIIKLRFIFRQKYPYASEIYGKMVHFRKSPIPDLFKYVFPDDYHIIDKDVQNQLVRINLY